MDTVGTMVRYDENALKSTVRRILACSLNNDHTYTVRFEPLDFIGLEKRMRSNTLARESDRMYTSTQTPMNV